MSKHAILATMKQHQQTGDRGKKTALDKKSERLRQRNESREEKAKRSVFHSLLSSVCFVVILLSPLPFPLSPAFARAGCSHEADWKVAAAAECLEKKDVGCAKLKLEPVLSREPGCGSALFVKGWIVQYFDGNEADGLAMQEKAMRMDPRLQNFWQERGKAIESNLTSQAFSHFDLQFYGAENRAKAWDAVRYLNEMYMDLSGLFGEVPPRRIPVVVFTAGEFVDAWRAPFIGGFFDRQDGKIRIRVDELPGGDEEFRHRARHEMTHAYVYQLYPHAIPSWASEGIAEFCARHGVSQGFWKDKRLEEIRKIRKSHEWLTLEEIQDLISKKRGSLLSMQLAYMESEALVIWIAKERGDSWFPRVLRHLREKGGSFDEAFKVVLGVSPATELEHLRHAWE